ncbi:beta-carotene 15,15'-monooxygenase [Actinomyces bowdenii]|uniref:beta-carotene 15,15'-monooxygenase n=1 Tax=Actinomyces bowdenii TaxID=131109 RepID=UPI001ABD3D81|nr:beta-carotene 15,15'-monooxygenase [Actinomyces bowdenii]MBO3725218.1 beta-carotene 15,15'-monooxygenase [Actinomyces bowdenii]
MTAALVLALGIAACAAPVSALVAERGRPRASAWARAALLALAPLAGAALGLGLGAGPWWAWPPLMGGAAAWGLWAAAPPASGPWHALARWATAIAALGACAILAQPAPGRLVAAAGAVGVVLLLAGPANEAVSALLVLARGARGGGGGLVPGPAPGPGAVPAPGPAGQGGSAAGAMRGGRWIGPLERILILLLAGAGANEAVAAIVAAKGVIRFPEISKDEGGRKAEEFLVGSLASWTLAALGIMLIRSLVP